MNCSFGSGFPLCPNCPSVLQAKRDVCHSCMCMYADCEGEAHQAQLGSAGTGLDFTVGAGAGEIEVLQSTD